MSIVMECLERYGIEVDDTIPMLEGGNIDMIAEWMSREAREARKNVRKANRMFKAGNYKQAQKLYEDAKKNTVEIRKNVSKIRTKPGVDAAIATTMIITACIPFIGLLMVLPTEIERMQLAGDSLSTIDQQKLTTEYGNTTSAIRNLITLQCRNIELACDDKIKRCKTGDR